MFSKEEEREVTRGECSVFVSQDIMRLPQYKLTPDIYVNTLHK